MMPLPVEEPPSKIGIKLRIKYNRTTIVLKILFIFVLLKKNALFSSGCVFLGHPVYIEISVEVSVIKRSIRS